MHAGQLMTQCWLAERRAIEKAQGRNRAVEGGGAHAVLIEVDLEIAQVVRRRRLRRPSKKGQEPIDVTKIVMRALLAKMTDGHVFQQPLTEGDDGLRAHGKAPV
jgi:hypothetical protein